ncbi:putative MFS transporter [Mycena venus]|uniref:Putative MFS transporter n=1 Tax=Mycena venus TaxID=2733690 RepID=A0A8H7CQ95_9AGAR|nr:putative MFS transporter [Mycena venus]
MSSAQDSVIATPELLEHTLSLLPMRDLLVSAPLVSKTWHAITLSPLLQRALFFEADPTVIEPMQNPLLEELFPPFFPPEWQDYRFWGTASSIKAMPWADAPHAFRRADASWRRMLVTQPPAQKMVIVHTNSAKSGRSYRRAVLRDLSLRMGVLYDVVVHFAHRVRNAASFTVRWHNGEGDLTLSLRTSSVSCMPRLRRRIVDEPFESDGMAEVEIDFGEWMGIDW